MTKQQSANPPSPDAPAPDAAAVAKWRDLALERARAQHKADTKSRFPAADLTAGVRAVLKHVEDRPELAAKLALKDRVSPAFLGAGSDLSLVLDAVLKKVPADRRHYRVVTPEDKKIVADAAEFMRILRDSAADGAKAAGDMRLADHIGRNRPMDGTRAVSVVEAIQNFRDGQGKVPQVLEEAGITDADLADMEAHAAKLQTLEVEQAARGGEKADTSTDFDTGRLAVEVWFDWLRARARMALKQDQTALRALLAHLPRLVDRRGAAKAQPADALAAEPQVPVGASGV